MKRRSKRWWPAVRENVIANTVGPETLSFKELLRLMASAVNASAGLVHTPAYLGFAVTRMVGLKLRDVVLTRYEFDGLMVGLLTSKAGPTGSTLLRDWLYENRDALGRQYVSELRRNFRR